LLELERFELQWLIYESLLRKFDGDLDFVRIKERFELQKVELEKVNCHKILHICCRIQSV